MKTKSFRVRSRRKSVDPYPPLPERIGSRETVPDTSRDERDVPQTKRRCGVGTGSSESLKFDECIVCEVSDERVTRCSGIHCPIRFHGECLTPEFGGSEDLSNPFCPYCWFKFVSLKSKSLREEVIAAEKAVSKYLDKDFVHDQGLQGEHAECSSKEDNNSHQPEDEGTGTEEDEFEASSEEEERVAAADNVHDAEGDDESGQVQIEVNQGRRRRRRVEMNATDSEISTTMELDGEDVSERGAATNVSAQPNSLRNVSFFNKDHRRRVFWTPEEEQMLKLGVEKFDAVARKNMPWRKILEMGKDVFHQTRSSTDLKDKWKNITKPQH
ncbi:hypothetical protein Bca4012_022003 [Brassica carinata]